MKKLTGFWRFSTVALILIFSGPAWADPPELQDKGKIEEGGATLDVGYCASPTMVDWNNDGAKDLIVGATDLSCGGTIWLYLNQGTDLNPVFDGYSMLEMNGNLIVVSTDG